MFPLPTQDGTFQPLQQDAGNGRHQNQVSGMDMPTRQEELVWRSSSKANRRKDFVASIGRLLFYPELFDLTIVCGDSGVRFDCHKAVVYAQSRTIREYCRAAATSAHRCTVRVSCHPLVFRMALDYLYTCDYRFFLAWDFPTRFLAEGQTVPVDYVDRLDCCELSLHFQVYILANCLCIPGLKNLSAFKIIEVLRRTSFPTVFPRFVREVYSLIRRENALLKRLIVRHADAVMHGLRGRNHYDGRFPSYILYEIQEFTQDLASGRLYPPGSLDEVNTTDQIAPSQWEC